MAQNPDTPASHFRLLDLPLELRQQVYEQHIMDRNPQPRGVPHKEKIEKDSQPSYVPLLLVNRQVSREIADIARRERTFTYNFPSQPDLFERWAKYCFRSRKQNLDYGSMEHLTIEVQFDERSTTSFLLSNFYVICLELGLVHHLRRLTIVFLDVNCEDLSRPGQAIWNCYQRRLIEYILEMLISLDNIIQATIEVPNSMSANDYLQMLCRGVENAMMNIKPLDEGSAYQKAKAYLERSERGSELRRRCRSSPHWWQNEPEALRK